jgi:hypothetical protein
MLMHRSNGCAHSSSSVLNRDLTSIMPPTPLKPLFTKKATATYCYHTSGLRCVHVNARYMQHVACNVERVQGLTSLLPGMTSTHACSRRPCSGSLVSPYPEGPASAALPPGSAPLPPPSACCTGSMLSFACSQRVGCASEELLEHGCSAALRSNRAQQRNAASRQHCTCKHEPWPP